VVVAITAVAFVGLAALAGQWVARQSAAQPSRFEASTRAPALGPVDVAFPSEWRRLPAKAAGLAGIERQPTLVFEQARGLPALAVLTVASLKSVDSPSLLPEPLRGGARIPLGPPRMVRRDGRRAWTYTAVPVPRGRQMMDITVLPTTAGIVTVACMAPELTFSVAAGCESRLRLTLRSAQAIRPTRDLGFRLRLGDVVKHLDLARVQQRARLLRARTSKAQARAALRLATAHARAARALAPLVATGASAEMVALLRESSRGYQRLSNSATAQDGEAFALAARAVDEADRRLGATYGAFRADQRVRPQGE